MHDMACEFACAVKMRRTRTSLKTQHSGTDRCLRYTRSGKSLIIVTPSFLKSSVFQFFLPSNPKRKARVYICLWFEERFQKAPFSKRFCSNENKKPAFSNPSCMKIVFEKLRFRGGLVWTVGLTVEKKLCFHFSPALCGLGLNLRYTLLFSKECERSECKPEWMRIMKMRITKEVYNN